MSFVWPKLLVLLALAPTFVVGYVLLQRRRTARAAALAAQGFVPSAATRRKRRLRHVPFALFLLALTLMLFALARPQMNLTLPKREGTVILAFDVSNSMIATDLQPTRMDAAKAAAKAFVDKQPTSIKIGVVAFSDGGLVTQAPTNVAGDVIAAIDRLKPQGATSLGKGIFTALNAIAGKPIAIDTEATAGNLDNVDIGYFGSASVILLSDGENTQNPDPVEIAKLAAVAGVHIYPIGIGSPDGTVVELDGFSLATKLDEALLTQIADVTDGTYYHAEDAASLSKVYDKIDLKFTRSTQRTEVTGVATGLGAMLFFVGGALSLVWFGRLV